jgi:uncharacterized protein (DUF433 family)
MLETTQPVPLAEGEDGTIRVTGSRVTLDCIVHHFQQGSTAEQIQESFPSLALRDIYAAITYYLQHPQAVEAYLRRQDAEAAEVRRTIEAARDTSDLRERLRQRRTAAIR